MQLWIVCSFFGVSVLTIAFLIQEIPLNNYYLLLLIGTPLALFTNIFSAIPIAKIEISKINLVKVILSVTSFTLILCFYQFSDNRNIVLYFLFLLIANFLSSLYIYYSVYIPYDDLISKKNNPLSLVKIIKKGMQYSFPLFVYGLNYKMDLIILPKFVSNSELGIYAQGVSFAELIWQIPAILSLVIFSHSISNDDNNKAFSTNLLRNTKKLLLLMIPLLILYWYIVDFFLPIFYGPEFAYSSMITLLLLPGTFSIVAFNILNADLSGKGKPMTGAKIFSFGAIINILGNLVIIPIYGINGAAVISTLTYILCTVLFIIRYKTIINEY